MCIKCVYVIVYHMCVYCSIQFAQFALLTQTLSVFGVYILQFVGSHKVKVIIVGQLVSQVNKLYKFVKIQSY